MSGSLTLEGYRHKEIAEREGISVANSQKTLERARKALMAEYQRLSE